jgi:ketosteroid isomerase-like protein
MPVRVLTVFAVLSLAACNVAPKSTDGAPDPALRARSDSLEAAEAALDKGRAIAFWAPDAIIQPAGMPQVNGRDSVAALYTFFFEKAGLKGLIGKPTQITMSQSGDLAFEVGVNHLTFGSPKGDLLDVGKYLMVWKKTNGVWYVQALAFTSDAAAPVPVAPVPAPKK